MVADAIPAMPFERSSVIDIAPMYRALQAEQPITRVRTPAGDAAWLVTGYEQVRLLLAVESLGRAHPEPERAPRFTDSAFMLGGSLGTYETERADHARMRRLLTRSFMVKRMNALRTPIQALVDDLLETMGRLTPPVDLHEELSFPLPVLVICQLLGVPQADREQFREWADQASNMHDPKTGIAGFRRLREYMGGLIGRKREQPGEDVISDLIGAQDGEDRFSDSDMVDLCIGVLLAGHETTMARIDLGTVLLLTHPDQRAALAADPSLLYGAVEEIVRVSSPTLGVISRYASEDLRVDGVTIEAGDLVLIGVDAANRDGGVFDDPDRFDIRREQNPHVGFGHGGRFCLGAGLARVELQTVFGTMFRRFPTLRLAVPVEVLRMRPHTPLGGLAELPVAW
jgi:cytochrome P450